MTGGEHQHLTTQGHVKTKYVSIEKALEVVARIESSTSNKMDIYLCGICMYYHIGRRPKIRVDHRIVRWKMRREDAIVGMLIGALKQVLNKDSA